MWVISSRLFLTTIRQNPTPPRHGKKVSLSRAITILLSRWLKSLSHSGYTKVTLKNLPTGICRLSGPSSLPSLTSSQYTGCQTSRCFRKCFRNVAVTATWSQYRTDALIYAKALSHRSSGTHALHLMEGADHIFVGHRDELLGSILEWWELKQRNNLSSGIWLPRAQQGTRL